MALNGEIMQADDELAHGRFVLLHEPGGQDPWQGDTRIVVFVKSVLEPDLAVDPLLLELLKRGSGSVPASAGLLFTR